MHRELSYWPVRGRFLLLLLALLIVAVAVLEVGLIGFAYDRLGLSRFWAYAALVASILGSRVNIPLAHLPSRVEKVDAVVEVFGVPYVVPALVRTGTTVVAVNVGGAVVPCALSGYLVARGRLDWSALVAVLIVTATMYVVARPVGGVGIVVPTLLPAFTAALAAVLVGGHAPAAVAFVAGTVGTLVGADLLHLREVSRFQAPVLSIGGAGTFDGIFVAGVLAVLLAGR